MSRRSRRQPETVEEDPKDNYEAEADDEVDDDVEVTRCICGQDELDSSSISSAVQDALKEYGVKIDSGLFIQCDKCSVWQHGYCVGLFTNDDVPDKYWCEQCKPELHQFIHEGGEPVRTLYKPVNSSRTKLMALVTTPEPKGRSRKRTGNRSESHSPQGKRKRHHYEDYDEQLQRALRESAKESGVTVDKSEDDEAPPKKKSPSPPQVQAIKEESKEADDVSNMEEDTDDPNGFRGSAAPKRARKSRARPKKAKSPSEPRKEATPQPQVSRAELLAQPSKPRYVGDASTIYELRKRIGAILEWLGRSQMELEEERSHKIELFNYKEHDPSDDSSAKVINDFNTNLKLMEGLTESILAWEQKFGRYAP
ncbi:hypothetical protein DICA3_D15544 [Diutina catenulata]